MVTMLEQPAAPRAQGSNCARRKMKSNSGEAGSPGG
jgi:hypothetical protein